MFCVIGDLHINKLSHIVPRSAEMIAKCLVDTVKRAKEKGFEDFILAGDVFDNEAPMQSDIVIFLKALRQCEARFYLIIGNHDFASVDTHSLQIVDFLRQLRKSKIRVISKPEVIQFGEISTFLCPHPFVDDMPEEATIAIGHFAVNGARGDNGFKVRTKNTPQGNWLLGDFHTSQTIKTADSVYRYAGSLTQLHWTEKPVKKVLLVHDWDQVVSLKVDLPYRLERLTIAKVKELPKKLRKDTYYTLTLVGDPKIPASYLRDNPNIVKVTNSVVKRTKAANVLLPKGKIFDSRLAIKDYFSSNGVSGKMAERALQLYDSI